MTNAERKASQLLASYGRDLAIARVTFFMEKAQGAMQTWWRMVLLQLQTADSL